MEKDENFFSYCDETGVVAGSSFVNYLALPRVDTEEIVEDCRVYGGGRSSRQRVAGCWRRSWSLLVLGFLMSFEAVRRESLAFFTLAPNRSVSRTVRCMAGVVVADKEQHGAVGDHGHCSSWGFRTSCEAVRQEFWRFSLLSRRGQCQNGGLSELC